MTRPQSTSETIEVWPEGKTPCEHEGCSKEAYFVSQDVFLCWDHMVPLRDAGKDVGCLMKAKPG